MNPQVITQKEFNLLPNELKISRGLQITNSLTTNKILNHAEQFVIPDDLQSFTLLSMEVSPFPTESRKVMKYIEKEQLEKFIDKSHFVQVDNYCVVFANVEDLSYHNFENILNLDHLFNDVSFQMTSKSFSKSKKIQIFNMEGSMDTLLSLDKTNYYTVPLNNTQRGGRRLIFHSNQLSYALTQMIQKSEFFDKRRFSHVNNVFRLNNFAPGDKKFKAHYDTPYADKHKNQYSRYTMLIYLTGNSNSRRTKTPPLTIKDFIVKSINDNDCIIFDQKCEHEGNAYFDRNKIFIRTELIYDMLYYSYDDKIARMFNTACYMTKEIEQQQYSADLFNNCVKMRYGLCQENIPKVYLAKRCLEIPFVTDGNYYWFQKDIDLKSIATLIILDYFNGKVYGLKNVVIESEVLSRKSLLQTNQVEEEESDQDIFNLLEELSYPDEQNKCCEQLKKEYQNIDDFVPDSLCVDFKVFDCWTHSGRCGSNKSAFEYFETEKEWVVSNLKKQLNNHTALILDNEIVINYDKIRVQIDDLDNKELPSGKISLSNFYLNSEKKINFASCNSDLGYTDDYIVFFHEKKLHSFCLPDISFQTLPNGIKLSVDIFKNGFVYHSTELFQLPYTNEQETAYYSKHPYEFNQNNFDENEFNKSFGNQDSECESFFEDNLDENIGNSIKSEFIELNHDQKNIPKTKTNTDFDDTIEIQFQRFSVHKELGLSLMDQNVEKNQNNKHQEEVEVLESQSVLSKNKKRSFHQEGFQSFIKQKKVID